MSIYQNVLLIPSTKIFRRASSLCLSLSKKKKKKWNWMNIAYKDSVLKPRHIFHQYLLENGKSFFANTFNSWVVRLHPSVEQTRERSLVMSLRNVRPTGRKWQYRLTSRLRSHRYGNWAGLVGLALLSTHSTSVACYTPREITVSTSGY